MSRKPKDSVEIELYEHDKTYVEIYEDAEGLYRWRLIWRREDAEEIIGRCDQGYNLAQCKINASFVLGNTWDMPRAFSKISMAMASEGY